KLDSLRVAGNYPGLSVAIHFSDNKKVAIVSGFADKEAMRPLQPGDGFLQGSVGKTYAAAIALQLVTAGKIDPDKKVMHYLGHLDWYARIPNAATITVRQLMNHTSGVMRYEFKDAFTRDLTENPGKHWTPADLLAYILNEKASFEAGQGWEYSDSNFILLGMIIEQVTGMKYYDLLKKDILDRYQLYHTFPSDKRKLDGLTSGFAGNDNAFGGRDKMIDEEGKFIINPQFEWTGGGVYSTTADLAKWGSLLYGGNVVDTSLMIENAVPAKLGRNTKYGLGVIIRETPFGPAYGHSGFFPGYLTEMLYFPNEKVCIAVQSNSSDMKS